MEEKKNDRRRARTEKAIQSSFIALLAEKKLEKITVQEIADRADINRSTFYNHYLDVYDLYDKVEQDILVEWSMLILKLEEYEPEASFAGLVEHLSDNRDVFTMVFSPNTPGQLRSKIYKALEGLFKQLAAEKHDTDIKDDRLDYLTRYRSRGCISVLDKWVNDGFVQSKEFIIKLMSELDSNMDKII